MTPMLALATLRLNIAAGETVPEDVANFICDALDRFVSGDAPTLDSAFKLDRGPGQRSLVATAIRMVRDQRLIEAAGHFPSRSTAATARALATALGRYKASAWRRERDAETCPHPPGSPAGALWRVLTAAKGEAPSAATIRRLLTKSHFS